METVPGWILPSWGLSCLLHLEFLGRTFKEGPTVQNKADPNHVMLRNAVLAGCVASGAAYVTSPILLSKTQVRPPLVTEKFRAPRVVRGEGARLKVCAARQGAIAQQSSTFTPGLRAAEPVAAATGRIARAMPATIGPLRLCACLCFLPRTRHAHHSSGQIDPLAAD